MFKRVTVVVSVIALSTLASLFLLNHPGHTYIISSSRSCPNSTNDSFDSIAALQADRGTNHRKFLYVCGGGSGFGSELNQLILAFAYSFASRRQFVLDCKRWNYGRFEDFFDFPKNFNRSLRYRSLFGNDSINQRIKYLKTNHLGEQLRLFRRATSQVQTIESKRPLAQYFWRQMTRETSAFVEQCRIRNLSNYIGLHVRRGDKLFREARKVPLQKYIEKIEETLSGQKSRSVVVTSDDISVLQELRRMRANWTFVSINITNSYTNNRSGHYQSRFNHLSQEEKRDQTRLLICQIQMLVDADYVFCTMSSNICRLVQTLRHQDPSTAISLDRPWRAT